jgi:hypothetical protein
MPQTFSPTRRRLMQISAATAGLALARPALAMGTDSTVVSAARAGLQRAGSHVQNRDVVAVADFGQPSRLPRLHLVDMASGGVTSLLVAHGRGSDPEHSGWLRSFSNVATSYATSEGDYLTGAYYVGQHGRSLRLIGLDATNSNAEARAIVVHSAWYVGPEMVKAHGMLGRSEGCFAVSEADLPRVLDRLGPGRLLVSRKL